MAVSLPENQRDCSGPEKSRWTARRFRRSARRIHLSLCLRLSAGRLSNCAFTSCTICLSKQRISEISVKPLRQQIVGSLVLAFLVLLVLLFRARHIFFP